MRKEFLACYTELRRRLKYSLGCEHQADDVLHETWLRVSRLGDGGEVRNPGAYFYRMAMNVAYDQRQKTARLLYTNEVEDLLRDPDSNLDPAQKASELSELEMLREALYLLTPRRREILVASRMEALPHKEIARRFGISVRMVEKELKAALEFCGEKLQRDVVRRFGPGAGKTS